MSEFPKHIEVESEGRRSAYTRRDDLAQPAAIASFSGESAGGMPVYESADGRLVVPTGKVWVRFAEGIEAVSRASDLANAGFRIESNPKYAPNGAWVIADEPAFALAHLQALRAVEDVEHVEPQMLGEASSR